MNTFFVIIFVFVVVTFAQANQSINLSIFSREL